MSKQLFDVSVCFYSVEKELFWSRMIKLMTFGDTHQHCGFMLHRNGVSTEFVTGVGIQGRFANAVGYRKIHTPNRVVYLGKHLIDFKQLQLFAEGIHSEDVRSVLWSWFVGRFVLPKMLPPTCTLITCQFLRLCGIKVNNFSRPQ